MSINPCNYMDGGVETITPQTRAAYGCLVTVQSRWRRLSLRPLCLWHKSAAASAVAACGAI